MATSVKKKPFEALSHLIPDERFSKEYISRRVFGVLDLDLLRYAKAVGSNVMIFGPTGPGKTSLVLAYAAAENLPVATIQCHGAVDPSTFWGGLVIDPDTGNLKGWEDSEATEIIKHGGILYLDEVNFLPAKIAATLHGLLDKRRQITLLEKGNEVIEAHPDLQIIASYNPNYEGTKPLNEAFKNRFKIKVEFDYDPAVEAQLLCVPVLQTLATKLRESHTRGDLDTPTSTNMLVEFEELAVDLSYEFAVGNFLNAFTTEERKAVREVIDLHADRIKAELKQVEELTAEQSPTT